MRATARRVQAGSPPAGQRATLAVGVAAGEAAREAPARARPQAWPRELRSGAGRFARSEEDRDQGAGGEEWCKRQRVLACLGAVARDEG